MTKRFLLVAACVCALFGTVTVAYAASLHKVNAGVQARVLTGSAKEVVYTGKVKDKSLGAGAVVTSSKPTSTAGKFNQTVDAYFKNGTIRFTGTTQATTEADNSTSYTGSLKASSGTGAFKKVSGAVKLIGAAPSDDATYATFKVTGSLKY